MPKQTLLAVLGRGMGRKAPEEPLKPTMDYDHWDITPGGKGRSLVFMGKNEEDPDCVLGGGELNLAAGLVLYEELNPEYVVFAYGKNSPSFEEAGYPTESHVVSTIFRKMVKKRTGGIAPVIVFNADFWQAHGKETGSGTFNELRNIFLLANLFELDEVIIVSIHVHMTRALGMLARQLQDPEFSGLRKKVRYETSEAVLLRADTEKYAERLLDLFGSQAWVRNSGREFAGLQAMYRGFTQTTQGVITPAEAAAAPTR